MKIVEKAKNWFEERTGLVSFFSEFMHEEIPGGTRFSYTLGSACMFLLMLQVFTGIWQLFYYVPTVDHAYNSYTYLRREVPFGWLMNGIHKWGGTLFTITVGLHALRVFIWGSYKKPREMVWFIGIILIVLTALFMFSGPVLPWDKKGYWAGQVGIGIAGSVPLVGPMTQSLMQGGNEMGQMALLRMYVMHVALLPGAIALFVVFHLIAFRRNGEAGPWDETKRKKVGYFWPEQIFKDIVMSVLIFLFLVYLSAFHPPEFSGLADPKDALYTPKPEWNFLFLYQLLKYLPGHLEFIGTAGVPFIIILLFGSLPFLDKGPDRNPFKRWVVILSGFSFVGIVLYLTWLGAIYVSPLAQTELDKTKNYEISHGKLNHVQHEKAIEAANGDINITGEKLYKTLGCTECHTSNGTASGKQGPDLYISKSNNRTREWTRKQIVEPQEHNQRTIMPPYSHLSERNVNLLLDYLEGLTPLEKPEAALGSNPVDPNTSPVIDGQAAGEELFKSQGCVQCHDVRGRKSLKSAPDLMTTMIKEKRTPEWLKTQITTPQAHNPLTIMPTYGSRLTDSQINSLVDYLVTLSTKTPEPVAPGQEEEETGKVVDLKALGKAARIIGNYEHGKIIFNQQCMMCHGPAGNPNAKGYPSEKGAPSLNPVDEDIYSTDIQTFVNRIDIYLQHGAPNTHGGLDMPNFGDSNTLTQSQIADLESYILHLNGLDRSKIVNPGIDPKEFFFMILSIAPLLILLPGLFWFILRYKK